MTLNPYAGKPYTREPIIASWDRPTDCDYISFEVKYPENLTVSVFGLVMGFPFGKPEIQTTTVYVPREHSKLKVGSNIRATRLNLTFSNPISVQSFFTDKTVGDLKDCTLQFGFERIHPEAERTVSFFSTQA